MFKQPEKILSKMKETDLNFIIELYLKPFNNYKGLHLIHEN